MSIDLLAQEAAKLFAIPGFLASLGWMMAIAMIVGAVLDEDGKNLVHWMAAILIFGGMAEVFRVYVLNYLLNPAHPSNAAASISIALCIAVVDVIGLCLGYGLAYLAKRRMQIQVKEASNGLENLS